MKNTLPSFITDKTHKSFLLTRKFKKLLFKIHQFMFQFPYIVRGIFTKLVVIIVFSSHI